MRVRAVRFSILCFVALAVAAGCGEDRPERKLEQAAQTLRETRGEVDTVRKEVDEQRAAVSRAEQSLAESQQKLRSAEERLAQASSKVESRATDAAVFRRLQSSLLEDSSLEDYAIAARVSGGVVTLSGQLKTEKERERALEIARGTPGVVEVNDQISIEAEAGTSN